MADATDSDVEHTGPSYISLRSAEVILSDVRPIKLKIDALRCINLFLDEFLCIVLSAARSLLTSKLRDGLLKVLPTALGKEALLEAEVELRAYWERTKASPSDAGSIEEIFDIQSIFKLLRLKCQGYSTLNDSDEDSSAEKLMQEDMAKSGLTPPKAALVAPASLYLTAILEAVCEHVLSNVGRVAARDSSRAHATVQDLFVALCEDDTTYGLFKSMKAYDEIENSSSSPKPQRSKSVSRTKERGQSISRTSSPPVPGDKSLSLDNSGSPSRISTDSSAAMATSVLTTVNTSSRSSFERNRAIKMFTNRSSNDHVNGGGQADSRISVHEKSESSIRSDGARRSPAPGSDGPRQSHSSEEGSIVEDFDNAVRYASTMKVSLTPDRLKTMEVYNRERAERGNDKQTHSPKPILRTLDSVVFSPTVPNPASDVPSSNGTPSRLRHVDSIVEDDEFGDNSRSAMRPRLVSNAAATSKPSAVQLAARSRSASAAAPSSQRVTLVRKASQEPFPAPLNRTVPKQMGGSWSGPPRTRTIGRNIESMDLDDIMGASDDEDIPPVVETSHRVKSPKKSAGAPAVSQSTRDLMDFLAMGPPEDSTPAKIVSASVVSFDTTKNQKTGRLQRMISKLKLGDDTKKWKDGLFDDLSFGQKTPKTPTTATSTQFLAAKKSSGSLMLANRPIPPRPPLPPVPNYMSSSQESLDSPPNRAMPDVKKQESMDNSYNSARVTPSSEARDSFNKASPEASTLRQDQSTKDPSFIDIPSGGSLRSPVSEKEVQGSQLTPPQTPSKDTPRPFPTSAHGKPAVNGHSEKSIPIKSRSRKDSAPLIGGLQIASDGSPLKRPTTAPTHGHIRPRTQPTAEDARDIRRLLARASTADECRVLLDMFLAKFGFPAEANVFASPYADVEMKQFWSQPSVQETTVESALVDFLLGGNSDSSVFGEKLSDHETQVLSQNLTGESESNPSRGDTTLEGSFQGELISPSA